MSEQVVFTVLKSETRGPFHRTKDKSQFFTFVLFDEQNQEYTSYQDLGFEVGDVVKALVTRKGGKFPSINIDHAEKIGEAGNTSAPTNTSEPKHFYQNATDNTKIAAASQIIQKSLQAPWEVGQPSSIVLPSKGKSTSTFKKTFNKPNGFSSQPYPQPKDTSQEISGLLQSLINTGQYNRTTERGTFLETKLLEAHLRLALELKDVVMSTRSATESSEEGNN